MTRFLTIAALLFSSAVGAQSFPFDVHLKTHNINNAPAIQSYSIGTHNGMWMVMGGRIDGLHQRQPWQSFNAAGENLSIYVIDPDSNYVWSAPLSGFNNDSLEAQLKATNPNFHQEGDYLTVIGGYGLLNNVHITHPRITVIDVPQMIASIQQDGTVDTTAVWTTTDTLLQNTGGRLHFKDSLYYLVGGHKFMGAYNPMGHNTYTQTYASAIRPFAYEIVAGEIEIDHYPAWVDTTELHRRDFNVTPMIDASGYLYFTAWSGVFKHPMDMPFLNAVEFSDTGWSVVPNFFQYYNHYHTASASMFSTSTGSMYTGFFGGIAQYYMQNGAMVQDNNVPFVKTVSMVEKRLDGTYQEYVLPIEMPGYFGASAEFIYNPELFSLSHNIVELDSLGNDTITLGWIYGGINSPAKNVFFGNMTNNSSASNNIVEVQLYRNSGIGWIENNWSTGNLGVQIAPNPSRGEFSFYLECHKPIDHLSISINNVAGQEVWRNELNNLSTGRSSQSFGELDLSPGIYHVTFSYEQVTHTVQWVVR